MDNTAARRVAVTYSSDAAARPHGHEASTRKEIARRLAALMGFDYAGEYDRHAHYAVPPYFVPANTLTCETASHLRIRDEHDLFGAVVPSAFMATKAITHPLLDGVSRSPAGWCPEFPRRVTDVVLDGLSVFARQDALIAGQRLLAFGAVRIKLVTGVAGLGQHVVTDAADLARALDAIDSEELAQFGAVVEQNLTDVTTYSVGQVRVADMVATYYGTQRLTTNNSGAEIYGGSELIVVRGDFDALLALTPSEDIRLAIAQARAYDDAADQCFHGLVASRRNYDVARGLDAAGNRRSGVLEQSWRLGGASGAEIGALEAFRADPSLRTVRTITREVYGAAPVLPANAAVYFSGNDPHVGPLSKYAWTEIP
jgi:Protein of unknown function (DUF3182)